MQHVSTQLLKVAIIGIGLIIAVLGIFWLPWQANSLGHVYPEFLYLQYPLLIGVYATMIPFFIALYYAYQIVRYIDKGHSFTKPPANYLNYIKYCAFAVCILYLAGLITLVSQGAGNLAVWLVTLIIAFSSFIIAIFASVLRELLNKAIYIQNENDLTV